MGNLVGIFTMHWRPPSQHPQPLPMTDQQMTSSGSGRMGSGGLPSMDVSIRSSLGHPGPSTEQSSSGQSSRAAERRVANSVIRSAMLHLYTVDVWSRLVRRGR